MQSRDVAERDYGTNCKDCERYRILGDVCVVEHGKKFLWEFCRDFQPQAVLPDYNELMRSVRNDMALERKKVREKKERERKKKLKERLALLEAKKNARRARLRKKRLREKERKMKLERRLAKAKQQKKEASGGASKAVIRAPAVSKIRKIKHASKTESKTQASQIHTNVAETHDSSLGESENKVSQMSNTPNTASSARATA